LSVRSYIEDAVWINVQVFRDLVNGIVNNSKLSELLEDAQLKDGKTPKALIQDVVTRWFSFFMLVERALELKPYMKQVLYSTGHKEWFPVQSDWTAAEWLVSVLLPLKNLSDMFEACHCTTISKVIPKMRVQIANYRDQLSVGLDMRPDEKKGLTRLCERLEEFFGPGAQNRRTMLIATFLDPRYKGMEKHTEEETKNVKKWVQSELVSASELVLNRSEEELTEAASVGRNVGEMKQSELSRYTAHASIDALGDAIMWWHDNEHIFPGLARLARKFLSAPCSSVPSERLFSSAGNFAQKRRHRLDPDSLEREVLLHHYFNESKRLDRFPVGCATIPIMNLDVSL